MLVDRSISVRRKVTVPDGMPDIRRLLPSRKDSLGDAIAWGPRAELMGNFPEALRGSPGKESRTCAMFDGRSGGPSSMSAWPSFENRFVVDRKGYAACRARRGGRVFAMRTIPPPDPCPFDEVHVGGVAALLAEWTD